MVIAQNILKQTIFEGETKLLKVEKGYYVIELTFVSDGKSVAKFKVNGVESRTMKVDDTFIIPDGSRLFIRDIFVQDEGPDFVQYNFFATGKEPIPFSEFKGFRDEIEEELEDDVTSEDDIKVSVDTKETISGSGLVTDALDGEESTTAGDEDSVEEIEEDLTFGQKLKKFFSNLGKSIKYFLGWGWADEGELYE